MNLASCLFGEAPERFDPVDVIGTPGEFILTMVDPKIFVASQVDQAILPSPSVGVLCIGLAPDHRLENSLARIGNDFRVDPIAAFQKSEDDRFSTNATPVCPGSGADRSRTRRLPGFRSGETPVRRLP